MKREKEWLAEVTDFHGFGEARTWTDDALVIAALAAVTATCGYLLRLRAISRRQTPAASAPDELIRFVTVPQPEDVSRNTQPPAKWGISDREPPERVDSGPDTMQIVAMLHAAPDDPTSPLSGLDGSGDLDG